MKRRAFTLVELLVVISILLILSGLVLAVFGTGRNSDKTRSAARIGQSAFLGAKDRALHAKDLRGVRLTRDLTNSNLVNGFAYLQPIILQSTGNIGTSNLQNVGVFRPNLPGNSDATNVEIAGSQGQTWFTQDQNGVWPSGQVQVRIPSGSGQWYQLVRQNSSPPYWGFIDANNRLNFMLQIGCQTFDNAPPNPTAIDFVSNHASIDIQLGNDVLPFHQPITLSSGVIIDLNYSSPNVQALAGIGTGSNPNVDVMFSPRGAISGFVGGLGPLYFLMRSLKDATAGANPWAVGEPATTYPDQSRDDRLILAVFPQTGLVQVFEINPFDQYQNPSPTTPVILTSPAPPINPDGIADNLFDFAQKGKSAGR